MTGILHAHLLDKTSSLRRLLTPFTASMLGTLIVLFPNNPGNMTVPSRDSGVFLYVGWRILMGNVPYRDVWDHKPPLIYFVDALGLTLTPDSMWGVWLLQFIFIFLTLFFLYKALEGQLGVTTALIGTVGITTGLLTILENGNVTEQYALLFQIFGIWLFIRGWTDDLPRNTSFWIGIYGGLAFNAKQTTIGLWIVFGLILLVVRFRERKNPFLDVLFFFSGWIIPTLVFVAYLAANGALRDFWEQAFLYNFLYIGKHDGIRRLIPLFIKGFAYLRTGWLLYFALVGWIAGVGYLWVTRKDILSPARSLILISVLDLPIEVLFISISGRSILHYYLTPLPAMAILGGTTALTIPFLLSRFSHLNSIMHHDWIPVFLLAVVSLGQWGQVQRYPYYIQKLNKDEYAPIVEYVIQNTQVGDKLLIIGAESTINFLARRESPTRYVYQYPLALTGKRPMFEEYFNQILENKPALIIDTRGRSQLTEKLYTPLQKRSPIVRDGVTYLGEHYQQVAQFDEWYIYRLNP